MNNTTSSSRIEIYPDNVIMMNNLEVPMTQFVNNTVNLRLKNKLIKLDDDNYQMVNAVASQLNKSIEEVINSILRMIDVEVKLNIEKTKVVITNQTYTVKRKVINNKITNW